MSDERHDAWGWELLVDAWDCDEDSISSEENIREFVRELVDRIDMVAYGETWLHRFAEHDPDKVGYTMFQAIETSAITAHFVEGKKAVLLNVHSCKSFDEHDVRFVVDKYFSPRSMKYQMIERLA